MDIPKLFTESFGDVLSNPKAILPSLILSIIIFSIAIIIVFIFITNTLSSNIALFINSPYSFISNTNIFNGLITIIAGIFLSIFIISFFVSILMNGILIAIGYQLSKKEELSIRKAISITSSKYLTLLGAGLLSAGIFVVAVGIPLLLILLIIYTQISLLSMILSIIFAIVGLLLLIIATIYLFEVNTAVIIENKGPIDAIRRSFKIASNWRIDIFVLILLMFLINMGISIFSIFVGLIPFIGVIITLLIEISASVWFGVLPVYFYYASGSNLNKNKNPTLQKIKKEVIKTKRQIKKQQNKLSK